MPRRRTSYIAGGFVCAALMAMSPVEAQTLCAEVDRIIAALSQKDMDLEGMTLTLPGHPEAEARCRVSLSLSGAKAAHCGWAFPYRAPEAQAGFEALLTAARTCVGADAPDLTDQPVNHPDAYALHQLTGQGRALGVSLKDKAGLQESFVFLRVMARE